MLTLPLITPRDSHELWFGSSHSHRTQNTPNSLNQPPNALTNQAHPRHNGSGNGSATTTTTGPGTFNRPSTGESLSALQLEERALRARKHNIASFGYAWIKPAGCPKTMLGMKEEEAEREEALVAAQQEMAAAAAAAAAAETGAEGAAQEGGGEGEEGMERDLDDDIPDADVHADAEEEEEGEDDEDGDEDDAEGLVEEGEEGLGEDDLVDEEGFMERDLDDDIPEAYPGEEEDSENALAEEDEDEDIYDDAQYEDFDNQPDLDAEVPVAGDGAVDDHDGEMRSDERDLDDDIPEAAEDVYNREEEWQHTDTEAELEDEDDDDGNQSLSLAPNSLRNSLASAPRSSGLPPTLPSVRRNRRSRGLGDTRETEAQRRFLQRWSGGGDAFDSSMLADEEEDLRASTTSQSSRRSIFGRFARRNGGPRDSLD